MKSKTSLDINEFISFDMFRSPCRRVEILSKLARSLNTYGVVAYVSFQVGDFILCMFRR